MIGTGSSSTILKDLAISLSLEASELLENFQWKSSEEAVETKRRHER